MKMKKCPKLEETPVTTEWQIHILCPNCKYYFKGQCSNSNRKNDEPCPLENVKMRTQDVRENETK